MSGNTVHVTKASAKLLKNESQEVKRCHVAKS